MTNVCDWPNDVMAIESPIEGGAPTSRYTFGDIVRATDDTSAMAYDEELANRLREAVQDVSGVTEKRMFGGLAFLINGNLAVSASSQGGLLLRVDPAQTESLIAAPTAQRFAMRGREMNGWLRIDTNAIVTDDEFERWVGRGVTYAQSLPSKYQ